MYLVFSTLDQAQTAQAQIDRNIVAVIAANEPEIVSDTGIIGRNAATGELDYDATRTTTWCEPMECVEGWYLIKPEINHPYFNEVNVLVGVEDFQEYDQISYPESDLSVMGIVGTEETTEETNDELPAT